MPSAARLSQSWIANAGSTAGSTRKKRGGATEDIGIRTHDGWLALLVTGLGLFWEWALVPLVPLVRIKQPENGPGPLHCITTRRALA